MYHTTLHNTTYTCLSYEWGSEDGGDLISINGELYHVGQNLWDFLDVASNKTDKPHMWIDALCIDQTNNAERSHQVQFMGTIYSTAREVWSWFGHNPAIVNLFSKIREWEQQQDVGGVAFKKLYHELKTGNGIDGLIKNTYWTRAWITQEVVLSQKLVLLAGREAVDSANLFVFDMDIPILSETFELYQETPSLLALLQRLDNRQCKIKRDIMYSLLALCREGPKIVPDYSISDEEVLLRAIQVCSKTFCLCTPIILAQELDIPIGQDWRVIIRDVALSKIQTGHEAGRGQWHICSACSRTIRDPETSTDDFLCCIKNPCGPTQLHFFWKVKTSTPGSQTLELFINSNHVAHEIDVYQCHTSGHSTLMQAETAVDIVLPLKALVNMVIDREDAGRSRELGEEHFRQEKAWLEFFDSSEGSLTSPYIWVDTFVKALHTESSIA
jgi:hypothetical protein